MSQYPSPYQQPQYQGQPYPPGYAGYDPYAEMLAPCRRAGIMLFVAASLFFMCGACSIVQGIFIPDDQLNAELKAMAAMNPQMPQITASMVRTITIIISIVIAVMGFVFIALGIFTRRGSSGAIITAIILDSLILLFMVCAMVGAVMSIGSGQPRAIVQGVVIIVSVVIFILLLVWLIQAAKAASLFKAASMQYQMQYYQSQQQQPYAQQQYPYPPQQQQQQWPGQYPPQPPQQPPPQT